MSKNLVLRFFLFCTALAGSLLAALELERRLPFPTLGDLFSEFVATRIWRNTGGGLLGHSIEIMVAADTLLCFAVLCLAYGLFVRVRHQGASKQINGQ